MNNLGFYLARHRRICVSRAANSGCWALPALLLLAGCPGSAPPPVGNENANANDNTGGTTSEVSLRRIAEGLTSPVGLAVPDDGTGRLFILDQIGQVRIIDADGDLLDEPFLDLAGRIIEITPEYDERGLLGLAFHPDYAANGRFFVYYSVPPDPDAPDPGFSVDCRSRIAEFQVSGDPNVADAASERILLEIDKPQFNHNGGQTVFRPDDGLLYISVGDGGGANDLAGGHNPEIGNGQDKTTLLGKILRIDVDAEDPYAIPPGNPFLDEPDTRPEIFALGLRNPWRFSFDLDDASRMFIADVGQDLFEEVSLGQIGANYGWNIREGLHCFDPEAPVATPDECPDTDADGAPLVDPLFEYSHLDGDGEIVFISITGGFLYRGSDVPGLAGDYVFGDYSSGFDTPNGTLFAARENADSTWTMRELSVAGEASGRIGRFVLSFGQDADGELYVLTTQNLGPAGSTGEVFRIEAAP